MDQKQNSRTKIIWMGWWERVWRRFQRSHILYWTISVQENTLSYLWIFKFNFQFNEICLIFDLKNSEYGNSDDLIEEAVNMLDKKQS